MSQTEPVPEQPSDQNNRLQESAAEAWNAAAKAFYAFVLVLVTLLGQALQALFVLARPALMVGTVILALYGSVQLFTAAHTAFGGDAPAMLIAALSVIVVPAGLIALAENYGIWAILTASGTLSWLGALAIARSPPIILAASIPVAIAATFAKFAFTKTREEN